MPVTTPAKPVTTVEFDQLELLLAELQKARTSVSGGCDLAQSRCTGAKLHRCQRPHHDPHGDYREIGLSSDDVQLSNMQAQEYLDFASVPTPVGASIPDPARLGFRRREGQWSRGCDLSRRIWIKTSPSNRAQVSELLQTAANSTTLPVVLVGDFNVGANVPSDPQLCELSGAPERWLGRRVGRKAAGRIPGLNCCQTPSVYDPHSQLHVAR